MEVEEVGLLSPHSDPAAPVTSLTRGTVAHELKPRELHSSSSSELDRQLSGGEASRSIFQRRQVTKYKYFLLKYYCT